MFPYNNPLKIFAWLGGDFLRLDGGKIWIGTISFIDKDIVFLQTPAKVYFDEG